MKERLFAELLEEGYDLRVMVSGRSMTPSLRAGDIVTLKKADPGRLRRGDIVLRRDSSGDGLVLHRLVGVERSSPGPRFLTRGDALLRKDRPLDGDRVLGRVVSIERRRGVTVLPDSPGRRLGGYLLSYGAPLRALASKILSRDRAWPKSSPGMRVDGTAHGTEVLLSCAASSLGEKQYSRAAAALAKIDDWPALLAEARREGLLPLLAKHLRESRLRSFVPEEAGKELTAFEERNRRSCLFLFQEAAVLVSRLGAEGIPAVPFKGPVMADALYGDACARPAGDLDMVIARKDASRARRLLAQDGYAAHLPVGGREKDYIRHYYAWTLVGSTKQAVIDLHWELARSFCPAVLTALPWQERLSAVKAVSREIPLFGVEDQLLLLTVHGGWHRWERLIWLCDVAEILKKKRGLDWDLLFREADRTGMFRALALGLLLARDLLAAPIPPAAAERIERHRGAAALAAEVKENIVKGRRVAGGALAGRTSFHLRLLARPRDRGSYLLGWAFRPNINDWLWISLPEVLSPLYWPLRPLRLGLRALGVRSSGGNS